MRKERELSQSLEAHRDWLCGYFIGQLKGKQDAARIADELTQTTLTEAAKTPEKYQRKGTFSAYLIGIAANVLRAFLRSVYRRDGLIVPIALTDETPGLPLTTDEYATTDSRALVERLIAEANASCTQQECQVLLLYYQGESLADIADLIALKEETVRSHLHRLRFKLIAHLLSNAPDLLGGTTAIARAWERACADKDAPPTPDEIAAYERGMQHGNTTPFRRACVKLARHLPLFAALLVFFTILTLTSWSGAANANRFLLSVKGTAYGR